MRQLKKLLKEKMSNYDFIGIGDIVTDAFIKLKEAVIEDSGKDGYKKICMRFGDKIPYEDVFIIPAVGNSINATVSSNPGIIYQLPRISGTK